MQKMDSSSEIDMVDQPSYESEVFDRRSHGLHSTLVRQRSHTMRDNMEDGFVILEKPENEIEEKKMEQNYMFGFKKWKAHVTQRPFEERSEAVKSLYVNRLYSIQSIRATILPGNIIYSLLIGWWVALAYLFVAAIMAVTVIGWPHAKFCWKLAWYFLWPFGKFVTELSSYELEEAVVQVASQDEEENVVTSDTDRIIESQGNVSVCENRDDDLSSSTATAIPNAGTSKPRYLKKVPNGNIWHKPATYVWLILGGPIIFSVHSIVIVLTGLLIIFIPISKLYLLSLKKLFFLPPKQMCIRNTFNCSKKKKPLEVLLCCYQAINFYFYKFTVDGMSILVTNMLVFVLLTLGFGILDHRDKYMKPMAKFVLGVISLIPLAHYIGFAITSISSQSRHFVGAFLNALFGSFIEIYLYLSMLRRQDTNDSPCYSDVVKSALTGSLLATMLLIPGLCMVVGGIKHKEQAVNVRSASVSSTLLFISVAGVFTPTIFAFTYGGFKCWGCDFVQNMTEYECQRCRYTVNAGNQTDFYGERVQPIVISIAALLPLAYLIGLVYSLFTHANVLEDHFKEKEAHGNVRLSQSGQHSGQHSSQHSSSHYSKPVVLWGRIKSVIILIVFTVAMAGCAEISVESLQKILASGGSKVTETFIGVTVIAIVPEIPEIINGIQFALKNNINLSLEIGSSIAVQVCLLQIPALVAFDYIFRLNFRLLFNDLHLWSVILSVIIMNYTFVDGKSDYFQGSMLCIVYFIVLVMFFYAPEATFCRN